MPASQKINPLPNQNFISKYLDGLSRCKFNYKMPTLIILAFALSFSLGEGVMEGYKILTGAISVFIISLLGVVKT